MSDFVIWDPVEGKSRRLLPGENVTFTVLDYGLLINGASGTGVPGDTVVTETAFGQSSAAGSNAAYSRKDHTHGSPTNPVTAHESASDPHVGYVLESSLNAKGDTYAASANDMIGVLTVGIDGQVLTADAASALGIKWADASAVSIQEALQRSWFGL